MVGGLSIRSPSQSTPGPSGLVSGFRIQDGGELSDEGSDDVVLKVSDDDGVEEVPALVAVGSAPRCAGLASYSRTVLKKGWLDLTM